MAAFGLYTHIQSNKRRSIALLIGLFLLVYVMVFAGALLAEALTARGYYGSPPLDDLIRAAVFDFVKALPFATVGTVIWIFIAYRFHQSMIDAVTGAQQVTRAEQPRLYNLLENLVHLARHHHADAAHRRRRGAQRLRHRHERQAIFHHRDPRPDRGAQRPGTRGRARPRAHPYPQRRRAHDGGRHGDRRRARLLRRTGVPHLLPEHVLGRRPPLARRRKRRRRRRRHCHCHRS